MTATERNGTPTPGREPYPWRHHLVSLLPTVALVLVLWAIFGRESRLIAYFTEMRATHLRLTELVRFWTNWGNIIFYTAYLALLLRSFPNRDPAARRFVLSWLGAFLITLLIVQLLKGAFGRNRPHVGERAFWPFSWGNNDRYSFPSGHTTEALGSAIPLAYRYRSHRFSLLLGLLAASIAMTRMYLGMHFMSDIAGSMVMGSLCACLTWKFVRPRQPRAAAAA